MDICVTNLVNSINRLRNFSVSREDLRSVKDALNGILGPDIKCNNFIYTVNLDKLPFGCIVFPVLSSDAINSFMIMGESTKIQEYDIELDSKVFDYGLTDEQVASIMIFNAYHMTKDRRPCENVREAVDDFFEAIMALKTKEEFYNFFEDICTTNEVLSIAERLEVAKLLYQNKTYVEIAKQTGASTATISRVNRSMSYGNGSYDFIFERMGISKDKE